jgi:hypothetical protein
MLRLPRRRLHGVERAVVARKQVQQCRNVPVRKTGKKLSGVSMHVDHKPSLSNFVQVPRIPPHFDYFSSDGPDTASTGCYLST